MLLVILFLNGGAVFFPKNMVTTTRSPARPPAARSLACSVHYHIYIPLFLKNGNLWHISTQCPSNKMEDMVAYNKTSIISKSPAPFYSLNLFNYLIPATNLVSGFLIMPCSLATLWSVYSRLVLFKMTRKQNSRHGNRLD